MSAQVPEGEVIDLTEIVGDIEIPCDWGHLPICFDGPARWVVLVRCPECNEGRAKVICTDCKDGAMADETAAGECNYCSAVYVPFRLCMLHIEPLNKRSWDR